RTAQDAAAKDGRAAPERIRLFSPGDLAAVKPRLSVRSERMFQQQALTWAALSIAGFYAVALVWRLRRMAGDVPLLASAHLLTAVGFAALLSRADPLRDVLLFVRYGEGLLFGLAAITLLSLVDFRKPAFLRLS